VKNRLFDNKSPCCQAHETSTSTRYGGACGPSQRRTLFRDGDAMGPEAPTARMLEIVVRRKLACAAHDQRPPSSVKESFDNPDMAR